MNNEEKEFTLEFNGYKKSIKIIKDFKDTLKRIKDMAFLQENDLKKMNLFYLNQYGAEEELDEQIFPFAFDFGSLFRLKKKKFLMLKNAKKIKSLKRLIYS